METLHEICVKAVNKMVDGYISRHISFITPEDDISFSMKQNGEIPMVTIEWVSENLARETISESPKRNLAEVIDRILEAIPPENKNLVDRINSIKQSTLCAAPEMQYLFWLRCASVLSSVIGDPVLDWQKRVADIFGGFDVR
jgi:hypothetical protein